MLNFIVPTVKCFSEACEEERHLHHRLGVLQQPSHQRVSRLMKSYDSLLLLAQNLTFLHAPWRNTNTSIRSSQSGTCKRLSVCLYVPASTRSTAYSKLKVSMDLKPSLAACRAASLQMLAMSAPGGLTNFPSFS